MRCSSIGFVGRSIGLLRKSMFHSLSGPEIKGLWGNLSGLTRKEKNTILHGEWRRASPIQLVPDPDDRDRGGCETNSEIQSLRSATTEHSHPQASSLLFKSDEELDAFLKQEDEDDAEEQNVPTLKLACEFYQDLATTANEELSPVGPSSATRRRSYMTNDERREEEIAYQASFFGSYYQQQGVVQSIRDSWKLQRKYQQPLNVARFRVNEEYPLSRLLVRHQLERASPFVFLRNTDPLVMEAQLASTSENDFTNDLTDEEGNGGEEVFVDSIQEAEGGIATSLVSAAGLHDLLSTDEPIIDAVRQPENDTLHCYPVKQKNHENCLVTDPTRSINTRSDCLHPNNSMEKELISSSEEPFRLPASISQIHWLQRQVACNTVVLLDTLSHLVSLLVVRLLCLPDMVPHSLVWDQFGQNPAPENHVHEVNSNKKKVSKDSVENKCSEYFLDVSQRLLEKRMSIAARLKDMDNSKEKNTDDYDLLSEIQYRLQSTSILLIYSSFGSQKKGSASHYSDLQAISSIIHPCPPNLLILQSSSSRNRQTSTQGNKNSEFLRKKNCTLSYRDEATSRRNKEDHLPFFPSFIRDSCSVVICIPPTSADGRRIRSFDEELETGNEVYWNSSPSSSSPLRFPPQDFLFRCREAATVHFSRLQLSLRKALESVKDKGYVVYATQSMNPVENEAVVCSVLTAHKLARMKAKKEKGGEDNVLEGDHDHTRRTRPAQKDAEEVSLHYYNEQKSMKDGLDAFGFLNSHNRPEACRYDIGAPKGLLRGVSSVECVDVSSWNALLNRSTVNPIQSYGCCVDPEEEDIWQNLWNSPCSSGLKRWSAVEGGPPDQECSAQLPEILESVANAARRVNPLTTTDDAWFVIVLQVTRIQEKSKENIKKEKKGSEEASFREVPCGECKSSVPLQLGMNRCALRDHQARLSTDRTVGNAYCLTVPYHISSSRRKGENDSTGGLPVFFSSTSLFRWYMNNKDALDGQVWNVLCLGAKVGVFKGDESCGAESVCVPRVSSEKIHGDVNSGSSLIIRDINASGSSVQTLSITSSCIQWKLLLSPLELKRKTNLPNQVDMNLKMNACDFHKRILWSAAFSGSEYSIHLVEFLCHSRSLASQFPLSTIQDVGVLDQNVVLSSSPWSDVPSPAATSNDLIVDMPLWLMFELLRTNMVSLDGYLKMITWLKDSEGWDNFEPTKKLYLCDQWIKDISSLRERIQLTHGYLIDNGDDAVHLRGTSTRTTFTHSIALSPRTGHLVELIPAVLEELQQIILFAEVEFVIMNKSPLTRKNLTDTGSRNSSSSADAHQQLDIILRLGDSSSSSSMWRKDVTENVANSEKRVIKEVTVRLRDALAYTMRHIHTDEIPFCPLDEMVRIFNLASHSAFSFNDNSKRSTVQRRVINKGKGSLY